MKVQGLDVDKEVPNLPVTCTSPVKIHGKKDLWIDIQVVRQEDKIVEVTSVMEVFGAGCVLKVTTPNGATTIFLEGVTLGQLNENKHEMVLVAMNRYEEPKGS